MTMRAKVPQPISGGVMLTYKCSAACRHCMYACSPRWKADWMTEEALERLLSQLVKSVAPAPWGSQVMSLNYGIHFTGGEPFLNFDLLLRAAEIAEGMGLPSTFVETNCSWCVSDEATRDKLQRLKQAGLKGILISVNPFYAEYVPFERTERCIRISEEVFGRNVVVYQMAYYHRFKRLGIDGKLPLEDYLEMTQGERLAEHVELFLQGRAACRLREFYPKYPASTFFGEPCRPSFLRNWHNHFDNYGNFIPGYCGGISLGCWENLDALVEEGIDLEAYPVLRYLVAEDVRGLLHFAKDFGYQEFGGGYLSKCDLCLDIRRFLVTRGDFEELSPKEFYGHLDAD
jgi:hypothetical protein